MISIKFTKKNLNIDKYGSPTFAMGEQGRQFVENMSDGIYVAEIKRYREKRSLDSNAFCWTLLNKLATKLNTTKEDLYVNYIKEKSPKLSYMVIKDDDVEEFQKAWQSNGLGWFAETTGRSREYEGSTVLLLYYGSSAFDSKQMSVFIDWIVQECKEQGIETDAEEVKKAKENWK